MSGTRVDKIRARESYREWRELLVWLMVPRSPAEIAARFFRLLDGKNRFGSGQAAVWSAESLARAVRDTATGSGPDGQGLEAVRKVAEYCVEFDDEALATLSELTKRATSGAAAPL